MSDKHQTSEPGNATETLEPDFEKMLADEGHTLAGRESKPADTPPKKEDEPETPKKEDPPADPDKKGDEKGKDDPKKDDPPKNDDGWRHAIARRKQEKQAEKDAELERLRKENDALKSGKEPDPLKPKESPVGDEKPEEKPRALTEKQKQLAAKYAIDEADFFDLFPTPVAEKVIEKGGLNEEQSKLLAKLQSDNEHMQIEKGYNVDFESNVLPLIKEEYPNITPEQVSKIKSDMFEKIQTDEFAMTPLAILYRGEASFRSRVAQKKAGPDEGTKVTGKDGKKVYDFDKVTEEDLKDPSFPFEEYSEWGEKNEKDRK